MAVLDKSILYPSFNAIRRGNLADEGHKEIIIHVTLKIHFPILQLLASLFIPICLRNVAPAQHAVVRFLR